ncbi:MAG: AraC family transcriptional regulator [Clostridia bacterium]
MEKEAVQHGTEAFPVGVYLEKAAADTEVVQYTHWHDELELFFIEDGGTLFRANSTQAILYKNDFALIRSGVIHGAVKIKDQPCRFCAIVFRSDFLASQQADVIEGLLARLTSTERGWATFTQSDSPLQAKVSALVHDVVKAYQRHHDAYELLIKAKLLEILYCFLQAGESAEDMSTIAQPDVMPIKRALLYIRENHSQSLCVDELAQLLSMSVGHFERLFKHFVGETPFSYLIRYRIQMSMRLLEESNQTVSEIAIETGFHDFSYFGKCFRKYCGISPRDYRKGLERQSNFDAE